MVAKFAIDDIEFSLIKEEDLTDLIHMLQKPSVCEHVFFGPNTAEETRAYFQPFIEETAQAIKDNKAPESHVFVLRKNGEFIGNCALIPTPYSAGDFSIGYNIDDRFWRRGYGDLCCQFLIAFGFGQLGANRLSADCMSGNLGSRRILEKNGFMLEGQQRSYRFKNGRYYDNLLFGLLKK